VDPKLIQERLHAIPVDLIRTIAIIGVIMLHAANEAVSPQVMTQSEIYRWWMVNTYQTLGRMGVPLFVMLTGALLLNPTKIEPVKTFFKKRWARIGLPFLFWGIIYFAWDYYADHLALTSGFIFQGILSGPYFQFWYLYMLVGLYLLTPLLRIVVAHATRETFKYIFVVWLLAAFIIPIPGIIGRFYVDGNLLTFPLWAGYFVLGVFLLSVKIPRRVLISLVALGLILTLVGTYAIAATVGGPHTYYFQDYFSPTIILASASLFLLLNTLKVPKTPSEAPHPKINWLLRQISQCTLAIFLFHVLVLETLQRGYLWGFTISGTQLNSIIEVPLITAVTLLICLAVILPLRKVPIIRNLIG
jgi:surface polysaccharide O-acyltransferase-like enzyme